MNLLIGSHVSYQKNGGLLESVEQALKYGSNTFMIYTGAPQNTKRSPIDEKLVQLAKIKMIENNIDINKVVVHAPYIINLASGSPFAIDFLDQELKRCEAMGLSILVLHPGSYTDNPKNIGINNIIDSLNTVLKNTSVLVLLETMAGKGTEIGSNFDELKEIIDNVKYTNIGICLDTCHLFDAGYDISNFDDILEEIDAKIGINKIGCVHINDSKNAMFSRKDRHENIGYGNIGFDNLLKVIYHEKLKNIPKILETPYVEINGTSYPPYKLEIDMIKNKKINLELISDIGKYYK